MGNRATQIRAGLKHPVIDGDGHWMEPIPVFLEYLSEVGGPACVDKIRALWHRNNAWYRSTVEERQHHRLRRAIWWGVTSHTLDKATALLPALLNERLPELGIDFAIMYPSFGLTINAMLDDELHHASARAYNRMTADMFAPFRSRFAPVAVLPARTHASAGYRRAGIRGGDIGVQGNHAAWQSGARDSRRRRRHRPAKSRVVLRHHRARQPL